MQKNSRLVTRYHELLDACPKNWLAFRLWGNFFKRNRSFKGPAFAPAIKEVGQKCLRLVCLQGLFREVVLKRDYGSCNYRVLHAPQIDLDALPSEVLWV